MYVFKVPTLCLRAQETSEDTRAKTIQTKSNSDRLTYVWWDTKFALAGVA